MPRTTGPWQTGAELDASYLPKVSKDMRGQGEFPVAALQPHLRGLNLLALSRESTVSYRTILRIKTGTHKTMRLHVADRLCVALGLSLEDIGGESREGVLQ